MDDVALPLADVSVAVVEYECTLLWAASQGVVAFFVGFANHTHTYTSALWLSCALMLSLLFPFYAKFLFQQTDAHKRGKTEKCESKRQFINRSLPLSSSADSFCLKRLNDKSTCWTKANCCSFDHSPHVQMMNFFSTLTFSAVQSPQQWPPSQISLQPDPSPTWRKLALEKFFKILVAKQAGDTFVSLVLCFFSACSCKCRHQNLAKWSRTKILIKFA